MKAKLEKEYNIFHYLITFIYFSVKSTVLALFWFLLGLVGYFIFQSKKSPLDLIVGLPLMIGSGGMIISNIYTIVLSLFSSLYNKGVCVICNN